MTTEARPHLIALPGGGIRVLKLAAHAGHLWALRYEVTPGEDMCAECGCTNIFGCPGGCSWVSPTHDLCSRCLKKGMLL